MTKMAPSMKQPPFSSQRFTLRRPTIRILVCLLVVIGLGVFGWLHIEFTSQFANDSDHGQPSQQHQIMDPRITSTTTTTKKQSTFYNNSNHNIVVAAGQTRIVTFTDHSFRYVAANWHERLAALGYTTQTIVAVDQATVDFFATHPTTTNMTFQYDLMMRPPLPMQYASRLYREKLRLVVMQIFALRWKYILQQLQQGIHVLLTDCDNIFSQYVALRDFEQSDYDVFHAYETRHPEIVFQQQGFCVCGGMSWFRASPKVIHFIKHVVAHCQDLCDDQDILNRIILYSLNMTWDYTPDTFGPTAKRTSNHTDARFNGLLQKGLSGTSGVTGHRVKIWDRDFAYRGPLVEVASECPHNNWVSMPMFTGHTRQLIWMDKLKSFDMWDIKCGHVNQRSFGIQYVPPGFAKQYNKRKWGRVDQ